MKRLINYIRNLFGADEELIKWCVETECEIEKLCGGNEFNIDNVKFLYKFVKQGGTNLLDYPDNQ